jgi:hypothetical protein
VVTCFFETAPVIVSPRAGAVVTSPVTFQWNAVPDAGVRYVMGVADSNVVGGQTSFTLPLAPGTYRWWLEADRVDANDRLCWSRAEQGPFDVALCGPTLEPRFAAGGLSVVEPAQASPEAVTLAPNPALVDGNTAVSAGLDLGYGPTLDGDTGLRDMGVELAEATATVDELHVWVDRILPPEVSASYGWRAYRSDDDLTWTEIALDAPVTFGALESRFEISISRTAARYLKVVARPLAAGVTVDSAFQAVRVTEVKAIAVEAPACVAP